jgi:hypothetical protein
MKKEECLKKKQDEMKGEKRKAEQIGTKAKRRRKKDGAWVKKKCFWFHSFFTKQKKMQRCESKQMRYAVEEAERKSDRRERRKKDEHKH